MPNLTIKPVAAAGNKLILQDQAGGAVLTTDDSGASIANATLASNVTNNAGVATGTIASPVTFPAGHILQLKYSEFLNSRTFSYTSNQEGYQFGSQSSRADGSYGGIVDGLTLSITTKQANSKIYISNFFTGCTNSNPNGAYNWGAGIFSSVDNYAALVKKGIKHGSYPLTTDTTYARWIYPPIDAYSDEEFNGTLEHAPAQAAGTTITYIVCLDNAYTSDGNKWGLKRQVPRIRVSNLKM